MPARSTPRRAARLAEFGTVDILFNNAGYGGQSTFLDWDLEDMERLMQVNYFGARSISPRHCCRRWSSAAAAGWCSFPPCPAGSSSPEKSAYAATKFAMTGLAEGISLEVEAAGVHVMTVYPGVVRTPFFTAHMLENMPEKTRNSMVEPADVVDAIFAGLAEGKREVTYPGGMAMGYVVRALAPGFLRKQVMRVTKK